MHINSHKKTSLFSAISFGVGSIIGSGWLFASYYAAQFAGPIALLSWLIAAVLSLALALLLGEIATMYPETGLIARLLNISHNRDYGFIIATANWSSIIVGIPAEAMASVQYIGHAYPAIANTIFVNKDLTWQGILVVYAIIIVYGLLNYWGIKYMAKANNMITTIKMLFPVAIGVLFMFAAFHPANFTAYNGSVAPYGINSALKAVVSCGIFYAFYGFILITTFAAEIENPKRNLPLALALSVLICLVIYLILQVSFIGAMNPATIATEGWHALQFSSPLANLAVLLGFNWVAIVLYADAALSPSGTGLVATGSAARILVGMSEDGQIPKLFGKLHPQFFISRISLVFTLTLCAVLVIFFDSWHKMMVVTSAFNLIACLAITIAFTTLRKNQAEKTRLFKLPGGQIICLFTYLSVCFLLTQCGLHALLWALIALFSFFMLYCCVAYQFTFIRIFNALRSSWTLFAYIGVMCMYAHLQDMQSLYHTMNLVSFFMVSLSLYVILIRQKNYNQVSPAE